WWQVLGSNQRRLSRRFYRPLPLATRATCLARPREDGMQQDSGTSPEVHHADQPRQTTTSRPCASASPATASAAALTWTPWHRNPPSTSSRRSTTRKSTTP